MSINMRKIKTRKGVNLLLKMSGFALEYALNTASFAMDTHEEKASGYSIGRKDDWDNKSISSRTPTTLSERNSPYKSPKQTQEKDLEEWDESASQRGGFGDVEIRGQKLTEIKELKKHIFKGNLEITPENYQDLVRFAAFLGKNS